MTLPTDLGSISDRRTEGIILLLTVLTLAVYAPVFSFGFLQYDDQIYVTANLRVQQGLTLNNVMWAFQSTDAGFWHPLTWLSLLLDSSLFGAWAGGFHGSNLILHIGSVIILFLALRRMTNEEIPCAFVAGLFALHPLHVESVAWIAERKDVLCGFFWMITLWGYARYAERPGRRRYWAVCGAYIACLMSKSMGVTLPIILLLLDIWPLRRLQRGENVWRLLREKIPLLGLSLAVGFLTILAQEEFGVLKATAETSLLARLANATMSVWIYVGKVLLPTDLAAFYPPRAWPMLGVMAAVVALLTATVLAWQTIRRWPFFAVGWFWYLATLAPVSGIVKVNSAAWADRYSYIPSVGLFLLLVWGGKLLVGRRVVTTRLALVVMVAFMVYSSILSAIQVRYWRDDMTLFSRALDVTKDNYMAHHGLAMALTKAGHQEAAMSHMMASLRLKKDARTVNDLGALLMNSGQYAAAENAFLEAAALRSISGEALNNLGAARALQGKLDAAIQAFEAALRQNPHSSNARDNLRRALMEREKSRE